MLRRLSLALAGLLVMVPEVFAAEVVYVGSRFAIVNAGKGDGLAKGDEVCLEQGTGEVCARIYVAREHLVGLRLSKSDLAHVAVGAKATAKNLVDSGPSKLTDGELAAFVAATESRKKKVAKDPVKTPDQTPDKSPDNSPEQSSSKASVKEVKKEPPPPATRGARLVANRRVAVAYLYSAAAPFQYHIPRYDLQSELLRSGSLWKPDNKVIGGILGVEATFAVPLTSKLAIVSGAHYRYTPTDTLSVDYDGTDPSVYAQSRTTARSFGFSVDADYGVLIHGDLAWHLLGGLDVDESRINYTATAQGGSETTIASLRSQLDIISLRLGSSVNILLGPIAVGSGITILRPMIGSAVQRSSEQNLKPEVSSSQRSSAAADLAHALGHKRSTFGAQLSLAVTYPF